MEVLLFVGTLIVSWFFFWLSSKEQKKRFEQLTEQNDLRFRAMEEAVETGFNRDSQNKIVEIVKRAKGKAVIHVGGTLKVTGERGGEKDN
jgi:CHASE3 domain sensor protein